MNKVIEYIISAKDKTQGALKSARAGVASFAKAVASNLMNIKAGFDMLAAGAQKALSLMQKSFAYEKMTVGFKTLIGSMDEAREHMKMLQEMGDTPPFSLEAFAAASKQLMVMTDGALGYRKTLELVGDAAAATGVGLESLAHSVGLAYSMIRDGQPLSRATMQLRQMGVITPEVAGKLTEMQQAGASATEMWQVFEGSLKRYNGAMKETEQTGQGLMDAIGSQWDNTLREVGEAFMGTAKEGLGALLGKMKELREDGSIQMWAKKIAGVVNEAKTAIEGLWKAAKWLWEKTGASDVYHTAVGGVKGIGTLATRSIAGMANGEGFGAIEKALDESSKVILKERVKGHYTEKLANAGIMQKEFRDALADNEGDERFENEQKEEIAKKLAEDKKRREEAQALKDEEERRLKLALLAQKEEERKKREAEKAAKELAEKQAAEAKKAAEEAAKAEEKARVELERAIAKERRRLWDEDFKAQQAALQNAQKEQSDAQSRLAAAQSEVARTWGWYRNKESGYAALAEERADAEARIQFEKDFQKLKDRRRDWRTGKLSDDDEIVKRVALAREEEQAAQEYARQTAEACARTAEAVEAMQTVMEEEA